MKTNYFLIIIISIILFQSCTNNGVETRDVTKYLYITLKTDDDVSKLDSLIAEISSDSLEKTKKIKIDLDEVNDGIKDSIPFTDELIIEVKGYKNGLLTHIFKDTIKNNSNTELPIEISLVKRMLSITLKIDDDVSDLDSLIAEISSDELEKTKKIKIDLDEVKDGIKDSIPFTDELIIEVSGYKNGLLTHIFKDTIKNNSNTELPIEISLVKRMLSITLKTDDDVSDLDSLIAEISSDELEKTKKIKIDLDEVKDGIKDSIPFTDELIIEVKGYKNGLLTHIFKDTIKNNSKTELPLEISLVKRMLSITLKTDDDVSDLDSLIAEISSDELEKTKKIKIDLDEANNSVEVTIPLTNMFTMEMKGYKNSLFIEGYVDTIKNNKNDTIEINYSLQKRFGRADFLVEFDENINYKIDSVLLSAYIDEDTSSHKFSQTDLKFSLELDSIKISKKVYFYLKFYIDSTLKYSEGWNVLGPWTYITNTVNGKTTVQTNTPVLNKKAWSTYSFSNSPDRGKVDFNLSGKVSTNTSEWFDTYIAPDSLRTETSF